jgi:hypothetical protein
MRHSRSTELRIEQNARAAERALALTPEQVIKISSEARHTAYREALKAGKPIPDSVEASRISREAVEAARTAVVGAK